MLECGMYVWCDFPAFCVCPYEGQLTRYIMCSYIFWYKFLMLSSINNDIIFCYYYYYVIFSESGTIITELYTIVAH